MNMNDFNENIRPLLKKYSFEYSSFANGDFGNLERIEIKGCNKVGTVEFWSDGWIDLDVYDCSLDDQVINILLSPKEKDLAEQLFSRLLDALGEKASY